MSADPVADSTSFQKRIRVFVDDQIAPHADAWDRDQQTPEAILTTMAREGFFGLAVPAAYGGAGISAVDFGVFCEEIGRGSASLLSLFTVHGMVTHALIKWGTDAQKQSWLPRLASGESLGAFALTEPEIGSDARSIRTQAVAAGPDEYVLTGEKKWISFGQRADVFLVLAQCEGKGVAILVEKDRPGFRREPMRDLLGFRAAMLASLRFDGCRVPATHVVGRMGFGFSHVAGAALDLGRHAIACGGLGLAQACLDASLDYARQRRQFDVPLLDHQLIQRLIADMIVGIKAARLLCRDAGQQRDAGTPDSILDSAMAKYFTSTLAVRVASDAVQIHGANGCSSAYPVQRHLRDAKILEIIEGSSQMQQLMIARFGARRLNGSRG